MSSVTGYSLTWAKTIIGEGFYGRLSEVPYKSHQLMGLNAGLSTQPEPVTHTPKQGSTGVFKQKPLQLLKR
jgi:hypothetical protein